MSEEEDKEVEVDVLEFSLNEEEIDELILGLDELKNTKTQFEFEVDDENELLIKYENNKNDTI
jgi:hypothetical protein